MNLLAASLPEGAPENACLASVTAAFMVKLMKGCVVYDVADKIVPLASTPAHLLAVNLNQTGVTIANQN